MKQNFYEVCFGIGDEEASLPIGCPDFIGYYFSGSCRLKQYAIRPADSAHHRALWQTMTQWRVIYIFRFFIV